MSLLNIVKGETIPSIEKKITEITAATDRARASIVEEQTNIADIGERLATAELYQTDTTAFYAEHARSSQRIVTLGLAIQKGDAELAKLNQRLTALRERSEREKYAATINKLADALEKALPAFKKSAREVSDLYLALPESAVASFTGATTAVMKTNVPLVEGFAHGGTIESAIADIRRAASMILSGEHALPLASDRTLGERLISFGRNPRAA
jgi:hypothetical protein